MYSFVFQGAPVRHIWSPWKGPRRKASGSAGAVRDSGCAIACAQATVRMRLTFWATAVWREGQQELGKMQDL